MLERAARIYRALGMRPLVVRKEVDGLLANRLQEALWREALWLVHNDLATVEEVDDAIRYSFGLRLALKGPFLKGGGGTNMRQHMEKIRICTSPSSRPSARPIFSGAVYVFRAKRADRIKLIFWDGTGLCLFAKRLEEGVFRRA